MKELEILAPTQEIALEKAAKKLHADPGHLVVIEEYEPDEQDLVEYASREGLEQPPSKEQLSLYVVEISFDHYLKRAEAWTKGLIARFAPGATAEAIRFRHIIIIRLEVPESSILIGKGGATLDALQHVVVRALLTEDENFPDIMLDVEQYREKKLVRLEKEAKRAAQKAQRTGRTVPLPPMSPSERKYIHNRLRDMEGIKTESRGKERDRHIVVESTAPPQQRRHGAGGAGGRGNFGNRGGGGGNRQGGNRAGHQGGGGGNRSKFNKPNISDAERQRLYGQMHGHDTEQDLNPGKRLLPDFIPNKPVSDSDNLADEIE